jgi:hypothetical protein
MCVNTLHKGDNDDDDDEDNGRCVIMNRRNPGSLLHERWKRKKINRINMQYFYHASLECNERT